MRWRAFPAILLASAGTLALPAVLRAQAALPDAPEPQGATIFSIAGAGYGLAPSAEPAAVIKLDAAPPPPQRPGPPPQQRPTRPGFPPVSPESRRRPPDAPLQDPEVPSLPAACLTDACTSILPRMSCVPDIDPFGRFVEGAYLHPLTPRQKGMLAFRNVVDPFNFATITFISALSTASDSHSAYGPGLRGFGKNVGVAYTETAVGEFFGTYLIPAVTHQDPHYHRLPNASVTRRIVHAIEQVAWTESDYGQGMPNYSDLVGTAITDSLGDFYVPGRKQTFQAGAARWATAIATNPIGNFISEFLPDVARRVNIRIVLVQRVINQVQRENGVAQ